MSNEDEVAYEDEGQTGPAENHQPCEHSYQSNVLEADLQEAVAVLTIIDTQRSDSNSRPDAQGDNDGRQYQAHAHDDQEHEPRPSGLNSHSVVPAQRLLRSSRRKGGIHMANRLGYGTADKRSFV